MLKQMYSSKSTSLFEIRLKNLDHDVIVLRGSEHNAASAFVSGKIVLSVTEPMTIKKITLKLHGVIRLRWPSSSKQSSVRPAKFDKKIFEFSWNSNEFSRSLCAMHDASLANGNSQVQGEKTASSSSSKLVYLPKTHSLKGSTTSLKNLGMSLRSMSSTSLSHLSHAPTLSSSGTSASGNHILLQGNYEIPFQAILPGDMPESVEGLPGADVIYKFEAHVERGKFYNAMVTTKHTRIVRTMTTDAAELSETMAVDNTWPEKVEYSLSIPSKAIAIGLGTPVSMILVPLLKGLKLGEIKITLVEMYSFVGYVPPPHTSERVVCEKIIAAPSENDSNYQSDKWEITSYLSVPPNLSKCTQDCDIQTHLKVRHKLKFVIGLKNPDGHVSELRASLPIQLFISPFVGVSVQREEEEDEGLQDQFLEEYLFHSNSHGMSSHSLDQSNIVSLAELNDLISNSHSATSFTGLVAPPVYEQHVYDRLWSDISPMESPSASGAQTPRSLYCRPPTGDMPHLSMSTFDTVRLSENLRQLSMQRQLQEGLDSSGASIPGRASFNLEGEQTDAHELLARGRSPLNQVGSSQGFTYGNIGGLLTPERFSPVHLSRVNSETKVSQPSLSAVPSYSEAMKNSVEDTLSPQYMPPLPGSSIDLAEVNRRFEENTGRVNLALSSTYTTKSKSFLAKGTSYNSRMATRKSSNESSPSASRSISCHNLSTIVQDGGSRTAAKRSAKAIFSMAP